MVNSLCRVCSKHTNICTCKIKFCPFCKMSLQEDLKHDHFRVCKQRNKYLKKRNQIHHDFCSSVSTENSKHSKKCLNSIKKSVVKRNKTKKYNQYCFNISCQNVKLAQKSLAKIQKQSNTKHIKKCEDNQLTAKDTLQKPQMMISPVQQTPLMCRKCHYDTSVCCCGHDCCPLCGIFVHNPSKEILQDHFKDCKNVGKQQCQKCFKFFSKKNYLRHMNLKQDCRNIISYNCLFCGEIWNTSRELALHLKTKHYDIHNYKKKLEILVRKSNPMYRGPMPWESPEFNSRQQNEIFEMYVYNAPSIFYNEAVEGGLFSTRFSLVLCNNPPELDPDLKIPSLSDQLVAKMYSILDIKKKCLKVNLQMSYILQNIHTCKLRFFESYSNFNVFEQPKLVTNYSDIDGIFKNVTKSSITEKVMHERPNTSWLPMLITSSHFIVTNLDDFPIGGGNQYKNSRYEFECPKSVVIIPTKNNTDCLFRSISYVLYCRQHNLRFPIFVKYSGGKIKSKRLSDYDRNAINRETNCMVKRWYARSRHYQVYLKNLPIIEEEFDIGLNIYTKKNRTVEAFYISRRKPSHSSRIIDLYLSKHTKSKLYHVDVIKSKNVFLNRFICPDCSYIFKHHHRYKSHLKSKCGYEDLNFPGGFQSKPLLMSEKLHNIGISVNSSINTDNTNFITYDLETLQDLPDVVNQKNTTYLTKNRPFSYSIYSSFEMSRDPIHYTNFDPNVLADNFYTDLTKLALNIINFYSDKYSDVFHQLQAKITSLSAEIVKIKKIIDSGQYASDDLSEDNMLILKNSEIMSDFFSDNIDRFLNCCYQDYLNRPCFVLNTRYFKTRLYRVERELRFLKHVKKELESQFLCVVIIGFNSSMFDLGVLRKWLFPKLDLQSKKAKVIKNHNKYMLIKTQIFKFIDASNFVQAGLSLDGFIQQMKKSSEKKDDITTEKGFFPYDHINSEEKLKETRLPAYEAFENRLKCCNILETGFDEEDKMSIFDKQKAGKKRYLMLQNVWKREKFQTMFDFVKYYNNQDVKLLLDALITYQKTFINTFETNPLFFVSLSSMLRYICKINAFKQGCSIARFSKLSAWAYHSISNNKTGGSSQVFKRRCSANETYIGPNICKTIKGFDYNSLYAGCLRFELPCSFPIFYIKKYEGDYKYIIQKEKQYTSQHICMKYLALRYGIQIYTKLNRGFELSQYGYTFDGYSVRTENSALFESIDTVTGTTGVFNLCVFEYLGCYYHGHLCLGDKSDYYKYKKWLFKRDFLFKRNIYVCSIWECDAKSHFSNTKEWKQIEHAHIEHSFFRKHKNANTVTEEKILKSVENGEFFGFVSCDIKIPSQVPDDRYEKFPPLYITENVKYGDWGPYTQHFYKKQTHHKDRKLLIQCGHTKNVLLATPLLQYYLKHKFEVSNVHYAIEYCRGKPYSNLIDICIALRRLGDKLKNEVFIHVAKLASNSIYGSLQITKTKHTEVFFTKSRITVKNEINSPSFRKLETINEGFYEITRAKKSHYLDTLPHHANFVLSYSKLLMLKFVYDFVYEFLKPNHFTFLQTDTDSLYLGMAEKELILSIKNSHLIEFKKMVGVYPYEKFRCGSRNPDYECGIFLPRECCDSCELYDKRKPLLMKLEQEGQFMICTSSKRYILLNKNKKNDNLDVIAKLSFAGARKTNFKTDSQTTADVLDAFFRAPLNYAKKVVITNFGMKKHLKSYDLFSYKETREFLAGFYIKRVLENDGIETRAINRVFTKNMNRPEQCHIVDENNPFSLYNKIDLWYEKHKYHTLMHYFNSLNSCKDVDSRISKAKNFLWYVWDKRPVLLENCVSLYGIEYILNKSTKFLFPGNDHHLFSGIESSLELKCIDYTLIKGKNYMNGVIKEVILEYISQRV